MSKGSDPPRLSSHPDEEGGGRLEGRFGAVEVGAMGKSMKPKFEIQMRHHEVVACNAVLLSNITENVCVYNTIQRVKNMIVLPVNIRIYLLLGLLIRMKRKNRS